MFGSSNQPVRELFFKHIEKDEIIKFFVCFSLLNLIWMGFWFGLNIMQSILVKKIGVEIISYNYFLSFFLSAAFVILNIYAAKRIDNTTILTISLGVTSLLILGSFLLLTNIRVFWDIILFAAIILTIDNFLSSVLLARTWNLITQIFRPLKLRRLNLFFVLSPILSGILANLIIKVVAKNFDVSLLVLIWFAAMLICFVLLIKFNFKSFRILALHNLKTSEIEIVQPNFKSQLSFYLNNKLVRILLLIPLFWGIILSLNVYQFMYIVNLAYTNENQISNFLGTMSLVQFSLILLFFILFKNKFFLRLGIFRSISSVPITGIIGYLTILFFFHFWKMVIFNYALFFFYYIFYIQAFQTSFTILKHEYREQARTFGSIATILGSGIGGAIIICIPDQQFLISLVGLIVSSIWLCLDIFGAKFYRQTLLNNLNKKELLFDALESIENINDHDLNVKLKEILNDKQNLYGEHEKIKVIETAKSFLNVHLIRELLFLLKSPSRTLREASIDAIEHMFDKVSSDSPIIHYQVIRSMKTILKKEPVDSVRARAAIFFFKQASKENFAAIFSDFVSHHNSTERLLAYKTLKKISIKHIDFLLKDGLHDEDPKIQGEVAGALWNFDDYQAEIKDVISSLLSSTNDDDISAGLKAIAVIGAEIEFIEKAKQFLKYPSPKIQILAGLYIMHKIPKQDPLYAESKKIAIDGLLNYSVKSEDWHEFVELIVDMEEDEIIDTLLINLLEQSKQDPSLTDAMKYLAEYMSKKIEDSKPKFFTREILP